MPSRSDANRLNKLSVLRYQSYHSLAAFSVDMTMSLTAPRTRFSTDSNLLGEDAMSKFSNSSVSEQPDHCERANNTRPLAFTAKNYYKLERHSRDD